MKKQFSLLLLIFFVSANINAEISSINIGDLTQLYKEQITKILVGNKLFGHYDDGVYQGPVEEIHYQNGDYEVCLKVSEGACSSTYCDTVSVSGIPYYSISGTVFPDDSIAVPILASVYLFNANNRFSINRFYNRFSKNNRF